MMHSIDCPCPACRLIRIVYALEVAKNKGELSEADYEWCLMVVTHHITMEVLDDDS